MYTISALMCCIVTYVSMLVKWGFHAIFIPDFPFTGQLFNFPLPLFSSFSPLTALHMCSGIAGNIQNHTSRTGIEGKGLLFSYTSFSYKPSTSTLVAPTNHFSLLKDSVWQLQSAEISAGKIINQTSCVGPCFWVFPIGQSSVAVNFFPLKPHIPCPVQSMLLIPVLSTYFDFLLLYLS